MRTMQRVMLFAMLGVSAMPVAAQLGVGQGPTGVHADSKYRYDPAADLLQVFRDGVKLVQEDVMQVFGESYEPVPPYLPETDVYNLPLADLFPDGTVGPNLTSLLGGTALIDELVLGEVMVDVTALPSELQQDYFDLWALGMTTQYVYAARIRSATNPGHTNESFGLAYAVHYEGQDVITFVPLGTAALGPATLVDYVQVFADGLGLSIVVQSEQQVVDAHGDFDAARDAALAEMANSITWLGVGTLSTVAILAVGAVGAPVSSSTPPTCPS